MKLTIALTQKTTLKSAKNKYRIKSFGINDLAFSYKGCFIQNLQVSAQIKNINFSRCNLLNILCNDSKIQIENSQNILSNLIKSQ